MLRYLLLLLTLFTISCGPRKGPLNADFSHGHEVSYQSLEKPAAAPNTEAPTTAAQVRVYEIGNLPVGLRKRASNQTLIVDPLRRGKFKRIRLTDIEAAAAYPTLAQPHRLVGEVEIALRIRYDAFFSDQEEILAEEAALKKVSVELAKQEAAKHGANAVVAVYSSMKPNGEWWRHPDRSRICRSEGKRCVKHSMRFYALYVSDAVRVVPTAEQLLERIPKTKGHKRLALRKITGNNLALPTKRHHCYRMAFVLDQNAQIPKDKGRMSAVNLFNSARPFWIDSVYQRSSRMTNFGCASKFGTHKIKLRAYSGGISTKHRVDVADFKGVHFVFEERRMAPDEAKTYFCGKCRKQARSCGVLSSCAQLNTCLRYRGMTFAQCRGYF